MTNNLKITHHPATDTAPQHWRSSDGFWTTNGKWWHYHNGDSCIDNQPYREAFFDQILNAEPRRARVGDHILSELTGESCEVYEVDQVFAYARDDDGTTLEAKHGHYTIVDPPERLTAKGSEITQKDGVWERSDRTVRVLITGGDVSVVLCGDQDAPGYCGGWWKDIDGFEDQSFTHISDDSRDLTNWEVE